MLGRMSQPECNEARTLSHRIARDLRKICEGLPEGWSVTVEASGQVRFLPPESPPALPTLPGITSARSY